jgi:small-conductance mechanosensitive channel
MNNPMSLVFSPTTSKRPVIVYWSFFFILVFLSGVSTSVQAGTYQQVETPQPTPLSEDQALEITPLPGAPVEVGGKVIFYVRQRLGSLTPAERAALISDRINQLASNPFAPPLEMSLVESSEGIDIMAGEQILLTVTNADAAAVGMDREEAAQEVAGVIQAAIETTRQQNSFQARALRFLELLAIILLLILILIGINRLYRRLDQRIEAAPVPKGKARRQPGAIFINSRFWKRATRLLLNILRWVLLITIILIVLPFTLRILPATTEIAGQLIELLLAPLAAFWDWLLANQDNFVTIALIILVTYILIRLVRAFFDEIRRGGIRLSGFDPEWAPFTSKIIAFLLIVLAVIVAFPYLPGSDSDAFKGITIFLGALFTISSASAVSNIVSGVIQTYTGAFRVGDVIKINEITGVVLEKRLLTTRVRSFKNETVSIPNSGVINANVVNYSALARGKGLILYTTITIGYDAPWQQVHQLLIAAALATQDILPEPSPYVLQTSLNDYHISYQINCYTRNPERMMLIYSSLHANIQDQFNQAGVEIMSPAFTALRDGNTLSIPPEDRPEGYQAPAFRIDQSSNPD